MDAAANESLQRARLGDAEALGTLLAAHTPALQADLSAQMPERWRALLAIEDVLQETFTDAFLAIRGFVPTSDGAFLAWLKKLARNNLIEAIRGLEAEKRGGAARRLDLGDGLDAHTSLLQQLLIAGSVTTPSQHVARSESRELLERAMTSLPEHYRRAIQCYDLDGKSIQDTAAELGCSPGGVHLVRHRAFGRLRALLTQSVSFFSPRE